jgi:hypothetical protein
LLFHDMGAEIIVGPIGSPILGPAPDQAGPFSLLCIRRRAASLRRIKTMAELWWILLVSVAMKVIMG